jgi:AcrR family transcriptional regulator
MFKKHLKPYHHRDLRESLLQAAVQLIGEVGVASFTLREVARRAGVSHNAPYRHFQDREELLGAVAEQGFRELTDSMTVASTLATGPLEQMRATGLAYVHFALRRPQHFSAMFETPVDPREQAKGPGGEAFHLLVRLVEACQQAGLMEHGEAYQLALVNWSMVHGIAKLAIAKRLPFETTEAILKFAQFAGEKCLVSGAEQLLRRN